MNAHPMMKCGHTANAVRSETNEPCCVICAPSPGAYEVNTAPPSLVGRMAQCGSCGKTVPSDSSGRLAFFEYRGPGAPNLSCSVGKCHFVESVHQQINPHTGRPGITDHAFVPRVHEFDSYYNGCRGWD